jgi:hypothetical protein
VSTFRFKTYCISHGGLGFYIYDNIKCLLRKKNELTLQSCNKVFLAKRGRLFTGGTLFQLCKSNLFSKEKENNPIVFPAYQRTFCNETSHHTEAQIIGRSNNQTTREVLKCCLLAIRYAKITFVDNYYNRKKKHLPHYLIECVCNLNKPLLERQFIESFIIAPIA